ncbi:MAG: hypothetical protein LBI42_13305 [Chitinispirillales bacterium]|jgi:hypothetical protein|nr:hypothetical protein [Chitinispirillales bacterium]
MKTIGVCGYVSTGSSAVVDLLHEFDDAQVLDDEFRIVHFPDGLEDLQYNLKSMYSSVVAIKRFRVFSKTCLPKNIEIDNIIDNFLKQIVQNTWYGKSNYLNFYLPSVDTYLEKIIRKTRANKMIKGLENKFLYKIECSIMPEIFDKAAKNFVLDILGIMGMDYSHNENKVIILNQPFLARDPIKSFKFYQNPASIIVDRDPRDHYLFAKKFLSQKGCYAIPCDNVDDYIKHYRFVRQSSQDLRKRKDVMFVNFEELVYDCENATKKVVDFVGVTDRVRKGECFKPTHSRNNTQLSKKYTEYNSDIKKIEQELPEYLFPFENYPDIESEGKMFWGCQKRKIC